jgi:hypothetical protein
MQAVREELHLHVGIGLESHGNLPYQWPTTSVNGLRDLHTDQSGSRRHIVLPATPDHGIALAHEKAIARVQMANRTVKIRQHRGITPIDDIQEQPVVAELGCDGLQQADICHALHQALRIPWGELQVSNPGVAGMVWVDRDMHRTLQELIGADITKGSALCKGAAGDDLQVCYCHVIPPFSSPIAVPRARGVAEGRGEGGDLRCEP